MGVVDTREALRTAQERDLDLVEVAPQAKPPVCRVMDYGKFKYKQKKRTHGGKSKHQMQIKEVRLRPKTGEHDIAVKLKRAREFLEHGDKVSVSMFFRGREVTHTDLGREIMEEFARQVEDIAKIESGVRMDGRRMTMLLSPK